MNARDDFLHQQRVYGNLEKRHVPCVYFNADARDESLQRACIEGGGVLFMGAHDVQLTASGHAQFLLSVYAPIQRVRALQKAAEPMETSITRTSIATSAPAASPAFEPVSTPAFEPVSAPCAIGAPASVSPSDEQSDLCELRVQQSLTLALCGVHNVSNALCAVAVGIEAGISLPDCLARVQRVQPADGRQKIYQGVHHCTVIDDAYNANPDSMRAALRVLQAFNTSGKRIAVLGDMGELGSYAVDMHREVGKFTAHCGIDVLVCVGKNAHGIAEAALEQGFPACALHTASCAQQALELLKPLISTHDVVLIKASHSMHLETIVKGLLK